MKGVKERKTSMLPKEKVGVTRNWGAHARGRGRAQDPHPTWDVSVSDEAMVQSGEKGTHDVGSSSSSRARGGMMREGR